MVAKEGDEYWFIDGNTIGSLLTEYILGARKRQDTLPERPLIVKSVTTTPLLDKIAEYYGAHVEETLTGFKWICQVIEEYERGIRTPYRKFICGG